MRNRLLLLLAIVCGMFTAAPALGIPTKAIVLAILFLGIWAVVVGSLWFILHSVSIVKMEPKR